MENELSITTETANKNMACNLMLSNRFFCGIRRWYMKRFYQACLRETLIRTIKGEQGLELARRFFNYKVWQLSKPQK